MDYLIASIVIVNICLSVMILIKLTERVQLPKPGRKWGFMPTEINQTEQTELRTRVIETNKDHYAAMRGDVDDWN